MISSSSDMKQWIKYSDSEWAAKIYRLYRRIRSFSIPCIPFIHKPLLSLHLLLVNGVKNFMRIFYWTPLFKSRLSSPVNNLYLYGGMPCVLGNLEMHFGKNCRVAGMSTFNGRINEKAGQAACIRVGENVDIGWQNSIAVGSYIDIGDHVRLAPRVFLAGFSGHPMNAKNRALGLPEEEHKRGAIILEKHVWLATGVTVNQGVTIGRGTIVAAGSVVVNDLPAGVLAAGNPAKVIKLLETGSCDDFEQEMVYADC
ncbi:MAG: acyltransferase [Pseudomonadales bacterium]|nr:acyltransferase [Pseudomonadales bacterium]